MMGGLNAIDSFYKNLSERYGYKISPDQGLLNFLGWGNLRECKFEEALKIFKENVRRSPDSPMPTTILVKDIWQLVILKLKLRVMRKL
jgi:hypothetical protein